MATSQKIRVMISSRSLDRYPLGSKSGRQLSEIRHELKKEIESVKVFSKKIFEVWINEETPPKGGNWDSWDTCLEAVRDCDILLVLSNGNAGWAQEGGDIGICHAELAAGLSTAPGKVWLVSLGNVPTDNSPVGQRNKRFQEYLSQQSLFRGGTVQTEEQLKDRVREALHDAVITLMQRGVREASKGRFYSGQALDWSRLDFVRRQSAMMQVLRDAIANRTSGSEKAGQVFVTLAMTEVLFVAHAVPAALSIGQAKEMVGQPFLRDHAYQEILIGKRAGPVHVIGCHKTVTEAQAIKFLGFADATFVTAPFGVFVADNIQKIQLAFISNCRDATTTRHGVQRFFEWLEQTGENALLANRGTSRARIIRAIAEQA
jgi:hypothetical protein